MAKDARGHGSEKRGGTSHSAWLDTFRRTAVPKDLQETSQRLRKGSAAPDMTVGGVMAHKARLTDVAKQAHDNVANKSQVKSGYIASLDAHNEALSRKKANKKWEGVY